MKKILALAVAVVFGLAVSANAQVFGVAFGRPGISVGVGVPLYAPGAGYYGGAPYYAPYYYGNYPYGYAPGVAVAPYWSSWGWRGGYYGGWRGGYYGSWRGGGGWHGGGGGHGGGHR